MPLESSLFQNSVVDYMFECNRNAFRYTEIEVNRVYFLWFCTKFLTGF